MLTNAQLVNNITISIGNILLITFLKSSYKINIIRVWNPTNYHQAKSMNFYQFSDILVLSILNYFSNSEAFSDSWFSGFKIIIFNYIRRFHLKKS